MSRTHELKCQPPHFAAVAAGRKTVEIRRDDRGFAVGDILDLREYDPEQPVRSFIPDGLTPEQEQQGIADGSIRIGYTGRSCRVVVTHILRGFEGLADGYVALSVRLAENAEPSPTSEGNLAQHVQTIQGLRHALYVAAERAVELGNYVEKCGQNDENRGQFLALVELTLQRADAAIGEHRAPEQMERLFRLSARSGSRPSGRGG